MLRLSPRIGILAVTAAFALLGSPAASQAYAPAPGYAAGDYATGFVSNGQGIGPIGVTFDQSDRLFVIDSSNGQLYSFPPGGGQVSPTTQVSQSSIPGGPTGAAMTADGRLYVTRQSAGDVVEIDPSTGTVLRTVASGISCATGITVDPISGDLFVSQNLCGSTIFRISGFAAGPGTVSAYSSLPSVDGMGFASDGTLFVVSQSDIYAIGGTHSAHPGAAVKIDSIPQSDGLAFGLPRGSTAVPFLVLNRLNGTATRIDFAKDGSAVNSDIFTGGTRGDFVAVDSHGCLYLTQSDRVVRVTTANGSCAFTPTTPGAVQKVASQFVIGCSNRRLVLIDVLKRRGHVLLLGAAAPNLIGKRVQIFFQPTQQAVASALVRPDGFFQTTAPLPPRKIRNTNRARYQARAGSEVSLDLKLKRRMIVNSLTGSGATVAMKGRVIPPLAKPRGKIVIQRQLSCTKYVTVKRVKANRRGFFRAKLAAPPRTQVAIYRATTLVRKFRTGRKRYRTFTLPRYVVLK